MTARDAVAEWLGRGAPAEDLGLRLRSELREVLQLARDADAHADPVPGSADDFADVSFEFEITLHVWTGDDTAYMSSATVRNTRLFDPRVDLVEQLRAELGHLGADLGPMIERDAMSRAYPGGLRS